MKWISAFFSRFWQRADKLTLCLALGLSALSTLCIYAIYLAGYCQERPWQVQALATGLGWVVMIAFQTCLSRRLTARVMALRSA